MMAARRLVGHCFASWQRLGGIPSFSSRFMIVSQTTLHDLGELKKKNKEDVDIVHGSGSWALLEISDISLGGALNVPKGLSHVPGLPAQFRSWQSCW